jgi:Family of unknown function (DUF5906)
MLTAQTLLEANNIHLQSYAPGRYYDVCPKCSSKRSRPHQNNKVLGITIEGDNSAHWGCNHCGWTGPEKGSRANGPQQQLPVHLYRDRDGIIRFRKVRNRPGREPKCWFQHLNDNDEWTKGSGGADTSILYRADEVANAIAEGRIVCCVEGEKDADNLWALGIAATCNAHGASEPGKRAKWTKAHSKQLVGADIIVLNDNDMAGYEHADATCRLSVGVAKRVRRLDLKPHWPDIPKGGDISDWLERGHTRKELDALIAAAQDYGDDDKPQLPPSDDLLEELNRDNCVVFDGGKTLVLRFDDLEHVAGGEHYVYRLPSFMRFGDFRNYFLNRRVQVGKRWVDLGSWWLEHAQRRQYRGVIFRPAGARIIDDRLNLWTGWGVESKQGDWSLLRKHIRETLAASNEDIYQYIMSWLAWAVQHPDQQAGVALVFIGERGSGKGTLGKALSKIFGQHALHLSSPEHLTGRFNAHLRQCTFLFADEAYGPKDKGAEGALKRLITEDTLTIEQKGRDPVEVPNLLHVMMASNNEWVIPAGAHERRFMVQRVSEAHRQDPAWFGPLYRQMREGGYEAMLFDLLARDLGDWHPRDIVRTEALVGQQEESLSPFDAWWFELLQTGILSGADDDHPDRALSNAYEEEEDLGSDVWGGTRMRMVKREGLYDQARRVSPKLKGATDAALGRYLSDKDRGCTRIEIRRRQRKTRGWQFPPLAECRARWLERFPGTQWHDLDLEDWTTGED